LNNVASDAVVDHRLRELFSVDRRAVIAKAY
jgi:hypothetical protein